MSNGANRQELRLRFSLASYARDRAVALALGGLCVAGVFGLGMVLALPAAGAVVMSAFVALSLGVAFAWGYVRRKRFYEDLEQALRRLEHAYYLTSVTDRPRFLEGQLLYDACETVIDADARDLGLEREAAAGNREFAELWTHEVKTPLAAARLTLDRMHGPDAMALRRELDRISFACERVLYSARMSNLSADYAIRPVDLNAVCRRACKELATLLIEKGVQPRFELEQGRVVLGDEPWICFVIKQLLSNAAKYGAASVRFSCEVLDEGTAEGRVELRVVDDGIGIACDELPLVFDRGFSGSNGRAEGSSTGMGLYLAAQTCAAMGVGLRLESALDEGTCAVLTFPCNNDRGNLSGT